MVVLVITSIVVGLAFAVLTLVSKQFYTIRDGYTDRQALLMFRERLSLDFDQCLSAKWNQVEEELTIQMHKTSFIYHLSDHTIIRGQDSLLLKYDYVQFYQSAIPVENGLVDAMEIGIKMPGRIEDLFIHRRSVAQDKIQVLWE